MNAINFIRVKAKKKKKNENHEKKNMKSVVDLMLI